jgi:multiple sugar transport system permease protein
VSRGRYRTGWPWLRLLVATVVVLVVLGPVVWLASLSFKPPGEWLAGRPTIIPRDPTATNYLVLFAPGLPGGAIGEALRAAQPVNRALINSLLVAPISTLLSVAIGFLGAYGVSRFRVGGNFLPFSVLTTRMFPPIAFAVPLLVYYRTLGLIDTRLGLILLYTASTLAFSLWLLKGFIDGVPRHIEEAALLDGASRWRVLFTITLPLVRGGLAATALFVFIMNWTEFLFALIFTSRTAVTMPVQLSQYVGTVGRFYGPQAALGMVASLPVLVAGYAIQRFLVRAFTFGLVK